METSSTPEKESRGRGRGRGRGLRSRSGSRGSKGRRSCSRGRSTGKGIVLEEQRASAAELLQQHQDSIRVSLNFYIIKQQIFICIFY